MAKIRIQDAENSPEPSEDGYVVLVKKLVYGTTDDPGEDTYDDFWDAEPDERVRILKEAAIIRAPDGSIARKYFVTHLVRKKVDGQIVEVPEELMEGDCKIFVEKDKIKRRRVQAKFTVALPEKLTSKNDSDYLAPYARIIYDLYLRAQKNELEGDIAKAARLRSRAHTFMFGMMLFTRCR